MKVLKKKKSEKDKTKENNAYSSAETVEMKPAEINKEMQNHLDQIAQKKEQICTLTNSISEELLKIHELRQKTVAYEEKKVKSGSKVKGSKRKKDIVDLDYELANMNMIKKLLDLSDHLVNKHEEFESKKLKKRTVFARKRAKNLRLQDEGKNGRQKILIVEDDATTANIISYVLTQHNYQVSAWLNAEDGLKMTLKEKPDLIILDIMLPGMDGFQLLSILKENEETAHIPVVLISSLAGEHDILKGLEIGAEDYILKPFSPRVLHLKVKKLMGIKNEHIAPHHRL